MSLRANAALQAKRTKITTKYAYEISRYDLIEKPHSLKRSIDKIKGYYQNHPSVASFQINDSGFIGDSNTYEFTLNIYLEDGILGYRYYPEVENRMRFFQNLVEHSEGLDGDLVSMIDVVKAVELDDSGQLLLLDFILPRIDGVINEQNVTHVSRLAMMSPE